MKHFFQILSLLALNGNAANRAISPAGIVSSAVGGAPNRSYDGSSTTARVTFEGGTPIKSELSRDGLDAFSV